MILCFTNIFGPFILSRSLIWYQITDGVLHNRQWSINSEIGISIIKHVQIIIAIICLSGYELQQSLQAAAVASYARDTNVACP